MEDGGVADEVGREPQYDVFADEFLDHAEDGFYNACVDRPACLELLGEVAGRRVLDAACGPGLYAAELARRGATCAEFAEAGFLIERLVEPRPLTESASVDPARYHRLVSEPTGFIAFRLRPAG
jgi:SAM-dependent methyltransferase